MSDDVRMEEDEMNESGESRDDHTWNWSVRGSHSWIWGATLILLGAVLLLQSFFPDLPVIIHAGNWWAVLLLLPGFNMIGRGWHIYRRTGRLWGPLLWGTLLVIFALSQLLEHSIGEYIWPVVLILGGALLLFGGKKG